MILRGPCKSGLGRLRHARVTRASWTGLVHIELSVVTDEGRPQQQLRLAMTADEWERLAQHVEASRSEQSARDAYEQGEDACP